MRILLLFYGHLLGSSLNGKKSFTGQVWWIGNSCPEHCPEEDPEARSRSSRECAVILASSVMSMVVYICQYPCSLKWLKLISGRKNHWLAEARTTYCQERQRCKWVSETIWTNNTNASEIPSAPQLHISAHQFSSLMQSRHLHTTVPQMCTSYFPPEPAFTLFRNKHATYRFGRRTLRSPVWI